MYAASTSGEMFACGIQRAIAVLMAMARYYLRAVEERATVCGLAAPK
jgi:hypothetical protein